MADILFHSPAKLDQNKELTLEETYVGQKVKVVGYKTVYEERANLDEEEGKPEKCSTGDRCLYLNKIGYLDTFSGKPGTPDMILLKDEAIILERFSVVEVA